MHKSTWHAAATNGLDHAPLHPLRTPPDSRLAPCLLSCRSTSQAQQLMDTARAYAKKAADRSDPQVVAVHSLLINVGLFVASAYFIQKYGYKLAL